MLPFLIPKKAVGVIVARRGKGDLHNVKPEQDLNTKHSHLIPHAEDLLQSIDERSVNGIAKALHNAFDQSESEPHHEGPHIEEEG